MRIEPKLNEIVNGKRGMLRGIDLALESECLVSAVGLIFMAIDALSALTRPEDQPDTKRPEFIAWSAKYLRPEDNLRCTAADLYAARCGVLHTYSADSNLQRKGEARRVIYQWREGPEANATIPLPADSVVVEVEALNEALRDGVQQFLRDAEMVPETRSRVQFHLSSLLCYAPWPRLEVQIAA